MKIISLYPSNDAYQVVDEEDQSVYYQGSQADCEKFIRYEQLRAKAKAKYWTKILLQRNL